MKYIASISFGKDSLAMLIKIIELGLPLDEVVYTDIRFDNEISGEMPLMAEWIPTAEKILKDKFNITVKHLTSTKTFKELFYTVKQKGKKRVGEIYGFPFIIGAYCNSRLKTQPMDKYKNSIKEPQTWYCGIAYDEPERYKRLIEKNNNKITYSCPLVDLKIEEAEAYNICKKYELLSPLYESSHRGGCWFCVKQNFASLKNLYFNYPKHWQILKDMEKDSFNTFKIGYTMEQLEDKFNKEENSIENYIKKNQISIFNKTEENNNE